MQKQSLDFLKKLIGVPSPSGFEMRVQDVFRARVSPYCDEVTTDVHGNAIGVINPKAKTRVMICGHCDEVGYIIMHIDDKGYAYFTSIGGVDAAVVSGSRIRIHGAKGPVFGVIGRQPIHLLDNGQRGKPLNLHEMWIDIGAKNKKEAERLIAVGDYATPDVAFEELRNDLVVGRGFDDRAGAFVVAETLRRLSRKKLNVAVYGVSTVQEEIGLRGARTSAFGIDPHIGIAIDVEFASDFPGSDPKRIGVCDLGKGPSLHRGPNMNPVLTEMIESVAKKKKIPVQVKAEPRATGTDANALQVTRSGVAASLIGIPNRYMHTPVEVVSLKDMDSASRLLAEVIMSLKPGQSFVPRSGSKKRR
jgi:putative aminopeptidase FrvX